MERNIVLTLFCVIFLTSVCYTVSQEDECVCVYYYLCKPLIRTVITDGAGIFDERIGDAPCTTCDPACYNSTFTCCRLLRENSTQLTTLPPTPPPTTLTPPPPRKQQCGLRHPNGVGFKLSDQGQRAEVLLGEFPWMVGILDDSGSYRCGGSLIHPSVVLTAAHCVIRQKNFFVRAGEWDSSNNNEILKHQDVPVASLKIHEDYYPPVHHNDIALLFLNEPLVLKSHINTVCLPPENAVVDTVGCYVTGWGKDQFGQAGQYPAILRKVDLPIVERDTCQSNLRKTKLGRNFNLHRSSLCAGGEKDKDACIGDGGGPLVCPVPGEEQTYQQVGIVSWGVECNRENVPGVYASVQYLKEWIDQQMNTRNFNKTYYTYQS